MIEEVWFIPHAWRDRFIREGFTVGPMERHHGIYCMIAYRKAR